MSIPNHGKILTTNIDFSLLSKLLNIDQVSRYKLPCAIASIGSPKLLIPISNREILFDMLSLKEKNNLYYRKDLYFIYLLRRSVNGFF